MTWSLTKTYYICPWYFTARRSVGASDHSGKLHTLCGGFTRGHTHVRESRFLSKEEYQNEKTTNSVSGSQVNTSRFQLCLLASLY